MNKHIILRAKSSDKQTFYNVKFTNTNGLLTIKCNCRAGMFSWVCKHKMAFLYKDHTILFDKFQKDFFLEIVGWINNSSYPSLIEKYNKIEADYLKTKLILELTQSYDDYIKTKKKFIISQNNYKAIKTTIKETMKKGG